MFKLKSKCSRRHKIIDGADSSIKGRRRRRRRTGILSSYIIVGLCLFALGIGRAALVETAGERSSSIPAASANFEAAFQGECGNLNSSKRNGNPCEHICLDLHDGTYECACFYGFTLAVDGYSCAQMPSNLSTTTSESSASTMEPTSTTSEPAKDLTGTEGAVVRPRHWTTKPPSGKLARSQSHANNDNRKLPLAAGNANAGPSSTTNTANNINHHDDDAVAERRTLEVAPSGSVAALRRQSAAGWLGLLTAEKQPESPANGYARSAMAQTSTTNATTTIASLAKGNSLTTDNDKWRDSYDVVSQERTNTNDQNESPIELSFERAYAPSADHGDDDANNSNQDDAEDDDDDDNNDASASRVDNDIKSIIANNDQLVSQLEQTVQAAAANEAADWEPHIQIQLGPQANNNFDISLLDALVRKTIQDYSNASDEPFVRLNRSSGNDRSRRRREMDLTVSDSNDWPPPKPQHTSLWEPDEDEQDDN